MKEIKINMQRRKNMEDRRFCQYCGEPMDSNALFCSKCGRSVDSQQNVVTSEKKIYQQTNFVMDMLRGFGKINSTIRVVSVVSAILLAVLQFFGMGYSINMGWFSSGKESISAIKLFYEVLFKSGNLSSYGIKKNALMIIFILAFMIGYVVLLIIDVILIKYIISDYHIDTIIDVDKGMSICGMIMFGITIIIGLYIRNQLGKIGISVFNINIMCYIGFIYSVILQIFSRLIIKSQLEKE